MFTTKELCRVVNGVVILSASLVIYTPITGYFDIVGTEFNALRVSMVIGTLLLIHEFKNYSDIPKASGIAFGALVSPFWAAWKAINLFSKKKGTEQESNGE